jgi:hypothetical protein
MHTHVRTACRVGFGGALVCAGLRAEDGDEGSAAMLSDATAEAAEPTEGGAADAADAADASEVVADGVADGVADEAAGVGLAGYLRALVCGSEYTSFSSS